MNNVHELSPAKHLVASVFDVGTYKAAHPIIGDHSRGEDLELAEAFERGECEEG